MSIEEIEIGDLVCLEDDEDFMIGIGIVIEIALNSQNEMQDLFGFTENYDDINDVNDLNSIAAAEIAKNFYLHKPVYLVLWSGDKNYFSEGSRASALWFFKNELKLVNKAIKD